MKFGKRQDIYWKYNGHCGYCGCELKTQSDMQVDHIVPKSSFLWHIKNKHRIPEFLRHLTENDVDNFKNLMPACRICNKWKSAFDLELFRHEISEQIKWLNEYNANYRLAKRYGLIQEIDRPIIFYFEQLKPKP